MYLQLSLLYYCKLEFYSVNKILILLLFHFINCTPSLKILFKSIQVQLQLFILNSIYLKYVFRCSLKFKSNI